MTQVFAPCLTAGEFLIHPRSFQLSADMYDLCGCSLTWVFVSIRPVYGCLSRHNPANGATPAQMHSSSSSSSSSRSRLQGFGRTTSPLRDSAAQAPVLRCPRGGPQLLAEGAAISALQSFPSCQVRIFLH